VSLLNVAVEVLAVLLVVAATASLPRRWRANRLQRPSWFLWGTWAWDAANRAIVPIVAAGWGLAAAFPASWLSDDSAVAAAVLLVAAAWSVVCFGLSGLVAITGQPARLSPPAWR
jgi:hypothetical protein